MTKCVKKSLLKSKIILEEECKRSGKKLHFADVFIIIFTLSYTWGVLQAKIYKQNYCKSSLTTELNFFVYVAYPFKIDAYTKPTDKTMTFLAILNWIFFSKRNMEVVVCFVVLMSQKEQTKYVNLRLEAAKFGSFPL